MITYKKLMTYWNYREMRMRTPLQIDPRQDDDRDERIRNSYLVAKLVGDVC